MVSIEFHYRPSIRNKETGKVFIRLIYQRRSGSVTLPYPVSPDEWKSMSVRLKKGIASTETEVKLFNEKDSIHSIVRQLRSRGHFTVADILAVYRYRTRRKGFTELVETLSDELLSQGSERTARAYHTTLRMLLAFVGTEDLMPGQLTSDLLESYQSFMLKNQKSLNTVSFYMRMLRAIYNKGVKQGYIQPQAGDLFLKVYTKVAPTRKRALTKDQLCKLEYLHEAGCLKEDEHKALSLFLFSFHSRGMCFVDMAYLKKANIEKGVMRYYRKKTGQYMEVKITTDMQRYLKTLSANNTSSYLFHLIRPDGGSPYVQYCCSLRKQNRLLNQISRKAGFSIPLTSHMARHSWATVAKKEQIPVEVISEALGHSRLETTYRYLDSFGLSVLDKANRKVSKAIRFAN